MLSRTHREHALQGANHNPSSLFLKPIGCENTGMRPVACSGETGHAARGPAPISAGMRPAPASSEKIFVDNT